MAQTFLHSQKFFSTGLSLGFGVWSSLYEEQLDALAADLHVQLKVAAKYLSRATDLPRKTCFDALAKAGGFDSWHHLSAHLAAAESNTRQVPLEWLEALIPLLPVNAGVPRELAPEKDAEQLLEQYWKKVADVLQVAPELVLDNVGAQMLGERAWKALLSRTPLDAVEPLYGFELLDDRSGAFSCSSACRALIGDLDDHWQGYIDYSAEDQKRARKWVEGVIARRHDFLEAGLALAQMKADARESDAGAFLDTYLAQAEALIPSDFKGKLPWSDLDNRFYHRMLFLRMRLFQDSFETKKAATLARKQLKLNPNDNLGLRYILPLLLLTSQDYPAAERAVNRFSEDERGDAAAIRAFVAFAKNDALAFRTLLLTALFTWPVIRVFIENSPEHMASDEEGGRGVIPDYESFADYAWPAYNSVQGLRLAATALFKMRSVVAAEAHLRRLWSGFWRVSQDERTSSREEWEATLAKYVEDLASA